MSNVNCNEATPISTNIAPSISSGAMLVNLNVSAWTGRKKDKRASAEVTTTNHAKHGSASVNKQLMGNCDELKAIHSLIGVARNHTHYNYTMPWSKGGTALLTTAAYFTYKPLMEEHQKEFYRRVDVFLAAYSWEITKAQAELGDLFNDDDYPAVEELRSKFRFTVEYDPMPESGDWRVDVSREQLNDLEQQFAKTADRRVQEAMNDVWTRLHEQLTHFSDRLDYTDDEKKKIFKEATVDNLLNLIDLLDVLNVTGDQRMKDMKTKLADATRGITPEALREDAGLRQYTKTQLDEAIAALPSLN